MIGRPIKFGCVVRRRWHVKARDRQRTVQSAYPSWAVVCEAVKKSIPDHTFQIPMDIKTSKPRV